jgi:hypothetical protein
MHRSLGVLHGIIRSSFAMRRQDILDGTYHVKIILEKYPFLKDPSQVAANME